MDTSPRMTEPNAPRSANTPMYTWIMKFPIMNSAAMGCKNHCDIPQPAQAPRKRVGEPQHEPAQQQHYSAEEKTPEQQLLSGVVAAGRRHFVVLIGDVEVK